MPKWHIWTHGVAVQIENEQANGLNVTRAADKVEIRQFAPSENLFHFPITTPTIVNDGRVDAVFAFVRVRTNNGAVVKQILVNEMASLGTNNRQIGDSGPLNVIGQNVQLEVFPVSHPTHTSGPIVVTVRVGFTQKNGFVRFGGAGIQFATQN